VAADKQAGEITAVRWRIPELTSQRAWAVLCRAFDPAAGGAHSDSTKLFIDGRRSGCLAPTPRDPAAGLRGWLSEIGPGHDVFAWARLVQRHDPVVFRALVIALEPWFARQGLPRGETEAEIFLGRYRSTPGGIHREGCANLHLVLDGTKNMHFWTAPHWPEPQARRRIDAAPGHGTEEEYLLGLDPAEHLGQALSLHAGPGQGFAWPAGTWHVGDSPHCISIALNIAAYEAGHARPGSHARPWAGRFHGDVPREWLEDYQGHLLADEEVPHAIARLSSLGMTPPSPATTAAAVSRSHIPDLDGIHAEAPVLWHGAAGVLHVAALGMVTQVPDTAERRQWLSQLITGENPCSIPAACRPLARWLAGHRAAAAGVTS
jgi:hypothetical protein